MRRRAQVLVPLLLAFVVAGCDVTWQAPEVAFVVQPESIGYGNVNDPAKLVGGETLLEVINDDGVERQITLARLDDPEQEGVPPELLAAELPRDDDRILRVSPVLEPRKAEAIGGVAAIVQDKHLFHVYLEPGQTYVLFDRLGGADHGVVARFTPGEQGAT